MVSLKPFALLPGKMDDDLYWLLLSIVAKRWERADHITPGESRVTVRAAQLLFRSVKGIIRRERRQHRREDKGKSPCLQHESLV